MEVRNGKPWANPEGYKFEYVPSFVKGPEKEWRCIIDQSIYNARREIVFYVSDVRVCNPDARTAALFRVRRKILHGYTVRDCPIADRIEHNYGDKCSEIIISQVRHNGEKHLTNYPYPVNWWNAYNSYVDSHTIAIFRVKRKGVHNG